MLGAISYDPIVNIELGPLSISPHGIGIAVGFLLGARLMLPTARRKGISEDDVYALLTRAAIGSLIGARVAYVINHLSDYDSPVEILKVWEGGISLLGGFLGAIALALPEMRKRGVSFWKAMDAAAPGMALGVIVGRIGDLVVGDHLGTPTDFFLGYRCPPPGVDTASPCVADVVHQTALYDLLLTSVLLTVLLVLRRRPRYDGFLISVFGAMYGINRLIEDFLREDVRRFGLTGSQWTALTFLLLCGGHLLFVRRTPRWGRWDGDDGSPGDTPDRGAAEATQDVPGEPPPDVPHDVADPIAPENAPEDVPDPATGAASPGDAPDPVAPAVVPEEVPAPAAPTDVAAPLGPVDVAPAAEIDQGPGAVAEEERETGAAPVPPAPPEGPPTMTRPDAPTEE